MANTIAKILGAISLTGSPGSVTQIDANLLETGDCCLCVTGDIYYIFKAYESNAEETPGPYTATNPPKVLKPETDPNTAWRWHLISPSAFLGDLSVAPGAILNVDKIKGNPTLQLLKGSGDVIAEVQEDGSFWVNKLVVSNSDTDPIEGLRAEFIGDCHWTNVMRRDGTVTFSAPVSGQEPIKADHLTTKNYVDEKIQILAPELYIRRDGSTSFEAPVSGFDPDLPDHLATKRYVDTLVETPARYSHAGTHAVGGTDAISPGSIGALSVTATAAAARKLSNARYFSIVGDVKANGVLFDGSDNLVLQAEINWLNDPTVSGLASHVTDTNVHGSTSTPDANKIIRRDTYGRAQVALPVALNDITNKVYVDGQISTTKTYVDQQITNTKIYLDNSLTEATTTITNTVTNTINNNGVSKLSNPIKLSLIGEVKGSVTTDFARDTSIGVSLMGGNEGNVVISTGSGVDYDWMVKTIYICENDADVTLSKANLIPDYQAMFNIWKKVSVYQNLPNGLESELTAWEIAGNVFRNTTNSSSSIGCVSPDTYEDYTFECLLSSTDGDDDYIGIVLAYMIDEYGYSNMITAYRTPGANGHQGTSWNGQWLWNITHNNLASGRTDVYGNELPIHRSNTAFKWGNGVYAATADAANYNTSGISWPLLPNGCWIKATRNKNIIKVSATDFIDLGGSKSNYLDEVTIDLTAKPELLRYNRPCSIGFTSMSQPQSMWNNIDIESSLMYIYNLANDKIERYDASTSSWVEITNSTILQLLPTGRICANTATGKVFFVTDNQVKKIVG